MHDVMPENAERIKTWLDTRGGLALWRSLQIGDDRTWTTPVLGPGGEPTTKPHWSVETKPYRIITDPTEVRVVVPKEVKRFRVGVRMGSQGLSLKVTDGGTRRIRKEVAKAGEGAWYEFDYGTQEAVIFVPGEAVSLLDYVERGKE